MVNKRGGEVFDFVMKRFQVLEFGVQVSRRLEFPESPVPHVGTEFWDFGVHIEHQARTKSQVPAKHHSYSRKAF